MPTRRPRSSPRPGIRTGASWPVPPQATLLYGNVIPPVGGDTLFANQYDAWDALSPAMKALLQDKQGIHSARRG